MATALTPESIQLLQHIFGAEWEEAWVCWKSNMAGCRAKDLPATLPDEDVYFSAAMMRAGSTTRSNAGAERVRALVLDDVGTKISKDAFKLMAPSPNWIVETSAGNYQCGYLVDMEPSDYDALRAAMKGSPIWGKSDGTDAVHLWRLPQGRNTKNPQNEFLVKLISVSVSKMDLSVFGSLQGSPQSPASTGADPVASEVLLQGLVDLIPNDLPDRQPWVNMAHAIYGASDGQGYDGFPVFASWAARWTAGVDVPAANVKLWDGIKHSTIGRGWLIRAAGAAAGSWTGAEAASVFDDGVAHPVQGAAVPTGVDPVQGRVAADIVRAWRERMRFNHDSGCWHVFSGGIWKMRPKASKEGFLRAEAWAAANAAMLMPAAFKETQKNTFYNGVEDILRQKLMIRQEDFDRNPWLLGCPGGTVDLKTGVLRKSEPSDFISKSCEVTPLEVDDCPTWKKFISQILKGDAASIHFIQQWLGYCLCGDTSEQKFVFLYGPGGNGKSVLMDTAARIMGGYFVKPVADLYFAKQGNRHMQEVAMLAGARMITVSEVPPNASWDEGKLKDHTGGGSITANFMRQNSFSFVPQFKLTALGNHQPQFPGGMNPAIKRRFKLMMLDFVPAVPDQELMLKLWKEAPGILRWMISGLQSWNVTRLMIPQAVTDATDKYVHDQDVFGLWLEQRVEKSLGTKTGSTDLFQDWLEFSSRNAGGEVCKTTVAFASEMSARGFKKLRLNTERCYADIRLISKAKSVF